MRKCLFLDGQWKSRVLIWMSVWIQVRKTWLEKKKETDQHAEWMVILGVGGWLGMIFFLPSFYLSLSSTFSILTLCQTEEKLFSVKLSIQPNASWVQKERFGEFIIYFDSTLWVQSGFFQRVKKLVGFGETVAPEDDIGFAFLLSPPHYHLWGRKSVFRTRSVVFIQTIQYTVNLQSICCVPGTILLVVVHLSFCWGILV